MEDLVTQLVTILRLSHGIHQLKRAEIFEILSFITINKLNYIYEIE